MVWDGHPIFRVLMYRLPSYIHQLSITYLSYPFISHIFPYYIHYVQEIHRNPIHGWTTLAYTEASAAGSSRRASHSYSSVAAAVALDKAPGHARGAGQGDLDGSHQDPGIDQIPRLFVKSHDNHMTTMISSCVISAFHGFQTTVFSKVCR